MNERRPGATQIIRSEEAEVTQWQPPNVRRKGETAVDESRGLLTAAQREAFVAAVAPIYVDAQTRYSRELLELVGL